MANWWEDFWDNLLYGGKPKDQRRPNTLTNERIGQGMSGGAPLSMGLSARGGIPQRLGVLNSGRKPTPPSGQQFKPPESRDTNPWAGRNRNQSVEGLDSGWFPRDMESALTAAMRILGDGGGDLPGISYDPQRAEARGRASEYDAKVAAMYNQLAGSIRGDAGGIRQNFDQAMQDTAQRSAGTQGQIQGASDAANFRNLQQLEALGIGEAAKAIVAEGRDLNTQAAGAVSDVAQRGQIAGDRFQTGQTAALSHNANLAGVAGLEGNEQRGRIGNELNQLLAQYDMAEQQANQEVAAANASRRSSSLGQALSLAQGLVGDDWTRQKYRDDVARLMAEQSAAQEMPQSIMNPQTLSLLQQLLEGSGAQAPESALDYAQLLKLLQPR